MPEKPAPPVTVGAVASLLGVSVRTLHHWDEIGLVRPSRRSRAGYRIYSEEDLTRLYRVRIYKELDLPLSTIASLLDVSAGELNASLEQQRKQVEERIRHLQHLSSSLDRLIRAHQEGLLLSAREQIELFGATWNPEWAQQAQQKWGDTQQWAEFAELSARRGYQDWHALADQVETLEQDIATAFTEGVATDSKAAHELAERHRSSISEYFSCTHSMHVCLGRMYAEDAGFRAHYDRRAEGLTDWLRQIIDANAARHGVDPDTVIWE